MAFDLVHRVLYEWDLKPQDKLVMIVMAEHANADHGWQCWPTVETLAKATGSSRRTVQRSLRALEDLGCISIFRKSSGRPGEPNIYVVEHQWTPTDAKSDTTGVRLTPLDGRQNVTRRVTNTTETGVRMTPKTVIEPVKETVIPKPPPKTDEAQTIQGLWNEVAERHGLTKWVKVTKWHEKQAKDRVKEHGWDGIRKALSVIDSDPFYQSSEARGWCDIRYFLRPGGRKEQPIVLLLEKADRPKGSFGDREDDAPLWKQVAEREKAAGGMR